MIRQILIAAIAMSCAVAQDAVPVNMTVTVEARDGKPFPELKREDVMIYRGKERLAVTDWTALQGERDGMELFLLIDDASAMTLGNQLADLREFIAPQPASALIGVGYAHNGITEVKQNLTSNHEEAAAALRLPLGMISAGASPYLALSDLIKRWPTCCVRREVVIISSGIDPLGGLGAIDPYLDTAIEQAQRAGVIVFTIYTPGVGHGGHSFFRMNWGQNHLAQLAEETGGECYMLGFGTPVSFAPYLRDLSAHLAHQYSVGFLVKPPARPGLIGVRFTTEVPDAEIIAAPRVFVSPAPRPPSER
ncbi:MAG TPA: hypothetical protein VMG40_20685 [Bryobacteraceae bacterium]|nr:hypothetical protein [Bryobacteraceae bacterium]